MTAEKINYVSLGDSIATGTLTPFSRTYSYVFYLLKKLRELGYRPAVSLLAQDGDASDNLLWKLNHSRYFEKAIQKADCITVSIGGNDLLKASSIPGFGSIHVPMARAGTKNFIRNWPQIVERIKRLNPDAKIVVLNLYNPYNQISHDKNLHQVTDRFLTQINAVIESYSEKNYRIADTYGAFTPFAKGNMHRVTNLYPASVLRNPHPTPYAQRMISHLICEQLELSRQTT